MAPETILSAPAPCGRGRRLRRFREVATPRPRTSKTGAVQSVPVGPVFRAVFLGLARPPRDECQGDGRQEDGRHDAERGP